MAAGIDVRHRRTCPGPRADGRCCQPTYQAHVFDSRTGKRIRKTFPTRAAAKLWRQDALVALRQGTLAEARPSTTMREACDAWLADARAGIVRTRGGDPFKPATIRAYGQALRLRVYPQLATTPFYRVRRVHLQDLVDRLVADGVAAATINTTIGALGAIYGRAVQRNELDVSPTTGVKVPAARNGRERFATPHEAAQLLAALPDGDRAVWATAMYAGLRRGEIMALRWTDVDFETGTIHVARSWDPQHGPGHTKNRNRRKVPIAALLCEHLASQRLRQPPDVGLCFGSDGRRPFRPDKLQDRADAAWTAPGLERLTLHDCRHTFASLAIAAGVNAKALSVYMGHSSVAITLDRYGHLMPGNEAQAAGLLDVYLDADAQAGVELSRGLSRTPREPRSRAKRLRTAGSRRRRPRTPSRP
jgi:integrase